MMMLKKDVKTVCALSAIAILVFLLGFIIAYEPDTETEVDAATTTTAITTQPSKKASMPEAVKDPEPLLFDGLTTEWYVYMDLDTITNATTPQYQAKKNYWLSSQGIWCCCNDYVVAMGSAWGSVGTRYAVTTDQGNKYTVVIGDIKADVHTDAKNQYTLAETNSGSYANVLEFIVDIGALPEQARISGNIGTLPNFAGKITSLRRLTS